MPEETPPDAPLQDFKIRYRGRDFPSIPARSVEEAQRLAYQKWSSIRNPDHVEAELEEETTTV